MLIVGFVIVIFIFLLEFGIRFIAKRSEKILSKNDLYPSVNENLVKKYNSYDAYLGWVNQPNSTKFESSQGTKITYNYDSLGSRLNLNNESAVTISTWGDSFCQCREVSDDATWQYFLSQKLGITIRNFGVGNYGVDQALLRLKRNYCKERSEYVILAYTPLHLLE